MENLTDVTFLRLTNVTFMAIFVFPFTFLVSFLHTFLTFFVTCLFVCFLYFVHFASDDWEAGWRLQCNDLPSRMSYPGMNCEVLT